MIFLTVGTHEPFDRLVRAVDRWCREVPDAEVFGQITDPGLVRYRPKHFDWIAWLSPQQHGAMVRASDFVISHAGIGSILAALSASKPIVVLPRRHHLHETRNDHQLATAQRWQSRRGVYVAFEEGELPQILNQTRDRVDDRFPPLEEFASDELTEILRELIQNPSRAGLLRTSMLKPRSIL